MKVLPIFNLSKLDFLKNEKQEIQQFLYRLTSKFYSSSEF